MAKILILENEDTGQIYRDYLSTKLPEHSFIWSNNIENAKTVINDSFSVVILDQRLDNNELGTSFMKWCKSTYPHIVGIMFSALATREDVEEAYDRKLIIKSIQKTDDGLIALPEHVITAINQSEYRRVANQENFPPKLIGRIWRWIAPFSPLKVYQMSDYIKDSEYIDEHTWEQIWIQHAGQTTTCKNTLEESYAVSVTCESDINIGVSIDKIKKIISSNFKLNADVKSSGKIDYSSKNTSESEVVFKMPDIPQTPDTTSLSSVSFEANRIYEIHLIGAKIVCPLCKYEKYITCEVHVPTNRIAQRKIYRYDDGTTRNFRC